MARAGLQGADQYGIRVLWEWSVSEVDASSQSCAPGSVGGCRACCAPAPMSKSCHNVSMRTGLRICVAYSPAYRLPTLPPCISDTPTLVADPLHLSPARSLQLTSRDWALAQGT